MLVRGPVAITISLPAWLCAASTSFSEAFPAKCTLVAVWSLASDATKSALGFLKGLTSASSMLMSLCTATGYATRLYRLTLDNTGNDLSACPKFKLNKRLMAGQQNQ